MSNPFRKGILLGAAGLLLVGGVTMVAQAQIAVTNQGYVPFTEAPINYRSHPLTDPVALLQKEIEAGKAKLTYEEGHGYLRSVLELLKVPVESQTLVFSKTSFQHTQITPDRPRALYYNDDVYVGAVHQGKAIEIVSFDPMQGAIFYLVDESRADKPYFQRAELDCTQCHIAPSTRGVPGVMMRSIYPNATGAVTPRAPQYITDQKSPWKERWGGWYVTGLLAGDSLANAVAKPSVATPDAPAQALELAAPAKPFDPAAYLVPTSDQVALMVLAHQTQAHNLITLTNYQTRIALHNLAKETGAPSPAAPTLESLPQKARDQITRPAEQLLRYMLFSGEAALGGVDGRKTIASSTFVKAFATLAVRDSRKRSLRDFDLSDRIFRYPLSYLVYSSAFDALPEPSKGYVYARLFEVLTGRDQGPDFAHLSAEDRQAILSILLETKPGLPADWRAYARDNKLKVAALPVVKTASR